MRSPRRVDEVAATRRLRLVNRFSQRAGDAAWGDHEPDPYVWTSGPWQVEVRGDELADIRYAGRPVLRSVRGVARDQDWETVPVAVREVVETDDGLDLALDLVGLRCGHRRTVGYACGPADPVGDVRRIPANVLPAQPDRLVVLQPAGSPGRLYGDRRSAVRSTARRSPTDLLPHQPALDIAGSRGSTTGSRPHGLHRRRLRDGGPAQLDGRLVQDLQHARCRCPSRCSSRRGHEVHQSVTIRCTQARLGDAQRRTGRKSASDGARRVTRRARTSPSSLSRSPTWASSWIRAVACGPPPWAGPRPRRTAALDVRIVADRPEQPGTGARRLVGRDMVRFGGLRQAQPGDRDAPVGGARRGRRQPALTRRAARRLAIALHRAEPGARPAAATLPGCSSR